MRIAQITVASRVGVLLDPPVALSPRGYVQRAKVQAVMRLRKTASSSPYGYGILDRYVSSRYLTP